MGSGEESARLGGAQAMQLQSWSANRVHYFINISLKLFARQFVAFSCHPRAMRNTNEQSRPFRASLLSLMGI